MHRYGVRIETLNNVEQNLLLSMTEDSNCGKLFRSHGNVRRKTTAFLRMRSVR
jgi:hypothetical protein